MQFTKLVDPSVQMLVVGAIIPAGTKKALADPSGRVYSLQPDGTFADRNPGSGGTWEQADVNGLTATYWYRWNFAEEGKPADFRIVGPVTVSFVMASLGNPA